MASIFAPLSDADLNALRTRIAGPTGPCTAHTPAPQQGPPGWFQEHCEGCGRPVDWDATSGRYVVVGE